MKNPCIKNLFKTTAVIFLTAVAFVFSACSKEQNIAQVKPQILVSSYVPYTIVENLVKDKADITMLMPPGVEPHSFEPLPKDILKVKKAPLFFYIDKTLEPWAYEINSDNSYPLQSPQISEELRHTWIDFNRFWGMTISVANRIRYSYPELEQEIQENYNTFGRETGTLVQEYSTKLANCKSRDIYHIGHNAFGWFAKNYNLNFKPLVNSSESQEPSPKDILEMIKQIKEKNIKYIFTEEALPPDMSELIAKQTGAQVLMLYTIEHVTKDEFNKQISYQDFMKKNLENLTKGLECN